MNTQHFVRGECTKHFQRFINQQNERPLTHLPLSQHRIKPNRIKVGTANPSSNCVTRFIKSYRNGHSFAIKYRMQQRRDKRDGIKIFDEIIS